jgi:AraC-like DNA-binding protein
VHTSVVSLQREGSDVLIVDTAALAARERADAVQALMSASASSSLVTFQEPGDVWARLNLVELGPGRVFNTEAAGMTLRRSPRVARASEEHRLALAVPLHASVRLSTPREDRLVERREMFLVDLSEPYTFGWEDVGSSYAFQVDAERLGLRMDTVLDAVPRLAASPLYGLVRDHVVGVTQGAAGLSADGDSTSVGLSTLDLMRALIVSAARGARLPADVAAETLVARVLAYTDAHLRDSELAPARIAAVHHVSLRQLYAALAEQQISLEQWIIRRRLERARSTLAESRAARRSIAAVSGEWGFSTPSFFVSRFRQTYGMTPQQWRRESQASPARPGEPPVSP